VPLAARATSAAKPLTTPMRAAYTLADSPEQNPSFEGSSVPAGRMGMPEDLENAVSLVASDGAGFVTASVPS
jgi:NAD(P)-dependent dehydrogenase (short-subunit alcohol dehydrogenase family)